MAVDRLAYLYFVFAQLFKNVFQRDLSISIRFASQYCKTAKNRTIIIILRHLKWDRYLKTVKGKLRTASILALIAAFVAGVVLACTPQDEQPAEGVLSHAEMVEVLQDIYIAEEKVNRLTLPRDSAERVFQLMEVKIFEQAGVNDSVFRASLDYYIAHPKQLEKIYAAIVDSLALKEQKALPDLIRP